MADETMTETTATTEAPAVAAAEKKTRKPRATKAVAEIATSEIAASPAEQPVKKTRAKRGSKTAPVKADKTVTEPKKVATRMPRAKAATAPVAPVDDIADLIKLEEENKQLRKELSDKLRSENADLRNRLGKA
ncbi:SyrB-like regulator [Agrobacterium sp. Ap1]|uniref:SyrB-like regulator n=1 Tax=Rhizobium/Agrobacterium group TaxID=227290 RepID=UPI001A8DFC38|nr:SyrB-like regulator [Agrobacterium sp. Ap1]MBO0144564.1 SyrB-like regulator [Agrobacterium sp. Ap1]